MLAPPPLPRTLQAALRDMGSSTASVRAGAIPDLVRHAVETPSLRTQAIGLLEPRLKDENAAVRAAAAVGLGDLRAHEALPSLLVAVEDGEDHVRQMALTALGEIGDARALPRLRRALGDGRPEMRYQALIALGHLAEDPDELASALEAAAADADAAIRYIALRIAEERLDEGRPLRTDTLATLARERLADSGPGVAVAAAIFLAKLGDSAGRGVLLSVVSAARSAPSCDKEDERAAVEMAGQLGLSEAVPALERRAFGLFRHVRDTCAFHARVALARLGHPKAVEMTLKDLSSGRRDLVEAAVVTAGRARLVAARPLLEGLTVHAADPRLVGEALALLRDAPAGGER